MGGSFREWIAEHREQIPSDPVRGLLHAAFTTYLGLWYTVTSRRPVGTHIYDEDWDLLIILDACRVDVLESVASEYDCIETVESRWSVGSHSHEWLAKTFNSDHRDEIGNTAYVTGNGHTHQTFVEREFPPDEIVPFCRPQWNVANKADFQHLEMLWETAHEGDLGVPPRAITDRTIEVHREDDPDRLIAHYMQPHIPYIAGALGGDREPSKVEAKGWKCLEDGTAERNEIWELYEENLRLVLEEVELLLENVEADKVCITADHGNAFGEYTVYGHPEGFPLPSIKKVPWVRTTAVDRETYEPSGEYTGDESTDIEEHLRALGYA